MSNELHDQNKLLQRLIIGVVCWFVLWAVVFYAPLSVAVSVWAINDTFNHCFLVLPAALYLLWQQRGLILSQPPSISWLGLLAVLGCLVVYALGSAAYIDLLQHLALFALIPATALFVFGWKVCLKVRFPLVFVMFSVPVGEELVPLFQEITADMAVAMLRFIEVPVFRNALYITVPNGDFVVAEACSGIRFFIACVVIGAAFAYLNFVSVWRALLFFGISIIFPIIANGIRAFGIVYIGHITNMEHAVGADHLVYGWFFFAIVIVLLLMIGHFMSDGARQWNNDISNIHSGWSGYLSPKTGIIAVSPLLAVLIAGITLSGKGEPFELEMKGYQELPQDKALQFDWSPQYENADEYYVREINNGSNIRLSQFVALYQHNEPGKELVSSAHRYFDLDKWTVNSQQTVVVQNQQLQLLNLAAVNGSQRLLVYWFVLPDSVTNRSVVAKLKQALNKIAQKPTGGALVALSYSYTGSTDKAVTSLKEYLGENPSIVKL